MSKTPRVDRLLEEARVNGECPYDRAVRDNNAAFRGEQSAVRLIQLLHSCRIESLPSGEALYRALEYGDTEAATELVRLGLCDPVTARGAHRGTILHASTLFGILDYVKKAYRMAPCLLEVKDQWGDTPLHEAIRHENVGVARFFLEQGALPRKRTRERESSLTLALRLYEESEESNSLELAQMIFAYGCRPSLADDVYIYDTHRTFIYTFFSRLRACGRAAVILMGLNRVGGKTRGNGRDALRLIARMVWVYRVDEVWDDGGGAGVKKNRI